MAMTVTATFTSNDFGDGAFLDLGVATGALSAASQTGATYGTASGGNDAGHASLTTTVTGSRVFGVFGDPALNDASPVPVAGTTTAANSSPVTGGNAITLISFRSSAATGTPGSTSFGFASGVGAGSIAMAEILPNGTIALDASAPSPTWADTGSGGSVTSASFTPVAGSLLVASVGADANSGHPATVLTVSGGGLTWTRLAFGASSLGMVCAVFIADVPAGGGGGATPAPVVVPQAAVMQAANW